MDQEAPTQQALLAEIDKLGNLNGSHCGEFLVTLKNVGRERFIFFS